MGKNSTAEQRAAHNRKYYENGGKEKIRSANDRARARNIEFLIEQKSQPCADCGVQYHHCVMDFDHLPEFVKTGNVGNLARNSMSMAKVEEEIAKCELVCANCHRLRTWNRTHSGV